MSFCERHAFVASARDLPHAEGLIPSVLRANRSDYAGVSNDRIPVSARNRLLGRQEAEAFFTSRWDGVRARRPDSARYGARFYLAPRWRGAGGNSGRGVSPGVFPRGPDGVGRPTWARAVHFSGGWQCGAWAR